MEPTFAGHREHVRRVWNAPGKTFPRTASRLTSRRDNSRPPKLPRRDNCFPPKLPRRCITRAPRLRRRCRARPAEPLECGAGLVRLADSRAVGGDMHARSSIHSVVLTHGLECAVRSALRLAHRRCLRWYPAAVPVDTIYRVRSLPAPPAPLPRPARSVPSSRAGDLVLVRTPRRRCHADSGFSE